MKSSLWFAFWGLGLLSIQAQTEQTLFNKTQVRGGFGGPIFTYGQIKGNQGFGGGGGGGLVINNALIGAFGHGELFSIERENAVNSSLAIGYGGLWLGYSFPTHKAIHGYAGLKIGAGGIGLTEKDEWWEEDQPFDNYDRAVFVLVPEAGLELNLFHWMRLAGTVGYRYIDGFEGGLGLSKTALNAPVFGLTMRFGWFGHRRPKTEVPQQ